MISLAGKRQAIAVHFVYEYEAAPNGKGKCWEGKDGIAVEIAKAMPFSPDTRTVRLVMQDVVECVRRGIEYNPERKGPSNDKTMGMAPLIGLNTRLRAPDKEGAQAGQMGPRRRHARPWGAGGRGRMNYVPEQLWSWGLDVCSCLAQGYSPT